MRILVDVDDVVADLVPVWIEKYNKAFDDTLKVSNITSWEIADFVKPNAKYAVYAILDRYDLYSTVRPIKGAYMSIRCLREMGHEIHFVSASFHQQKAAWLKQFAFISTAKELIVCQNKSMIKGDILIDDGPHNVANFAGSGGKAILFSQPWNLWYNAEAVRADSWQEVLVAIGKMENKDE